MANNAASMQLPIMVRKPRMVWPGLDKAGLHLKSIAGDGNCLFASLSDQLYGTPTRHGEIRATVIEHMRTFRPLYEDFVHANDVIQKRATRATTESVRKHMEEDAFEGYLIAMSRLGTYGGQPELLAFVRAYDQDVMVHLPPSTGWDTLTLPYKNEHREPGVEADPELHICYGGDEERQPHYDSSEKSDADTYNQRQALKVRTQTQNSYNPQAVDINGNLSARAVRHMKSDPDKDMMHELVTRGSKDLRSTFGVLNDPRPRSPSVASSHYSTSSKRSIDDDADHSRASKRTDRKQRSLRSRAALRHLSGSPRLTIPITTSQPTSSGPPTPTSSQGTDSSLSEQAERAKDTVMSSASSPHEVIVIEDDSDDNNSSAHATASRAMSQRHDDLGFERARHMTIPSILTETSRSTVRT